MSRPGTTRHGDTLPCFLTSCVLTPPSLPHVSPAPPPATDPQQAAGVLDLPPQVDRWVGEPRGDGADDLDALLVHVAYHDGQQPDDDLKVEQVEVEALHRCKPT